MSAPPLILGLLLLFLAWRTRERVWRLTTLAFGLACLAHGLYVIAVDPRAFATHARIGSSSTGSWPRGLYP